jgi:hypothetical protein
VTTFKAKVLDLCSEVASEFSNWSFESREFKNKALKHTIFTLNLGFYFESGSTPIQPAIVVLNKKSMALFKKLFGCEQPTSIVPLGNIRQQ